MTSLAPLEVGTLLQNRYRITRQIGRGGMGAVYDVIDERLNSRVALKQILRSEPTLRQAFEREARLLANLQHPSLPRVTNSFAEAESDFIVMDYIAGDDLQTIVTRDGALPVEQVLTYADQLLQVLTYLHSLQPPILHRDIKPENIKISERNQLYLLDFGIAKGSAGVNPTTGDDLSVAAFSAAYAPIEQRLSGQTTVQSDLFSVGATLYHLLTGQRPVAADQRQQATNEGLPDPLIPCHRLNSRIPEGVGSVIQRALAFHMADRYSSGEAFRRALHSLPRQSNLFAAPAPTELGTEIAAASASVAPAPREQPAPPPSAPAPPAARGVMRAPSRSGQPTLQKRIDAMVRQVFERYPGAWLFWCDPRGDWRPLLERVAGDERMGGFPMVSISDHLSDAIGGLQARQSIQARIDAGESFVVVAQTSPDQLGWLWGHALLAERRYSKSLREQLLEWGWRPQSPTTSEDEIALLARQGLQHDPATWGGGGLQPDLPLLLEVLAGGTKPSTDEQYILDLTIEQTGLPPLQSDALERWRTRALARLLVTQAHTVAPRLIADQHELLIAEGQRSTALELLVRWQDSLRLSKKLPTAILEADKIATLASLLSEATSKQAPFLSRAAESIVFANTCTRLAKKSGKELLHALVALQPELAQHVQGFWGQAHAYLEPALTIPWDELLRLSFAAQHLLDAAPERSWSTIDEAIRWFTSGGGWRLDQAGDELLRQLSRSTPELLALITPLREAYRSSWERSLIQWSDLWSAAGCPMPALPTAGTWLTQQLAMAHPIAILVIDAFRYDLAARLAQQINEQEGMQRATIVAARAPLPSITALGMPFALPIAEEKLRAEFVGSEWQVSETSTSTNVSIAENRRAWLRERGIVPTEGVLTLADALQGTIPRPSSALQRLLISDAIIDRLGHDDELEALGAEIALKRYSDLIIQLRDANWRHICIVTDHGYITWSGSTEKRQQPPIGEATYRSRRALAYPANLTLTEPHALAPGGGWRVLTARGASSWSAYGGLGYFHGGASLQEWIIPCVQIGWPGAAQPVDARIQPLAFVLSAQPKVVLLIARTSLFAEDALSRHVEVLIRHATNRAILFRSAQVELTPSQEQRSVTLRQQTGATAEWEAPLRIEVRDASTEAILDQAPSVLRVRLDEW